MKYIAILAAALGMVVYAASAPPPAVHFTDVTTAAGIHFQHHNGKFGKKYLPETMGAGCAFVDLDGDGYPDIVLLNGKDWKPSGHKYLPAYYHNNKNGTFTDVTRGSGLDVEMYAMGIAVA